MRYRQPKLAVDCIIRLRDRVVLIYRRNEPKGWALPGGFVNYGETVEQAVVREVREETGLELGNLQQFHVYSDPKRDRAGIAFQWSLPLRAGVNSVPVMMQAELCSQSWTGWMRLI